MAASVIVIAEVEDPVKWEKGFRSHADLFRSQSVSKPVDFAITGNTIAVCMRPDDLDTFMEIFESPATADAMKFDGIKRETVQTFVLDKRLEL